MALKLFRALCTPVSGYWAQELAPLSEKKKTNKQEESVFQTQNSLGDFGRKLVVWKSVAKDWGVGPGDEAGWPGHRRSFWLVEEVRPGGGGGRVFV